MHDGTPKSVYCDATFVLMSAKAGNQPDGSPCTSILPIDYTDIIFTFFNSVFCAKRPLTISRSSSLRAGRPLPKVKPWSDITSGWPGTSPISPSVESFSLGCQRVQGSVCASERHIKISKLNFHVELDLLKDLWIYSYCG